MATKIEIVEDETAICQMYKMKFEYDGFEVHTAVNGKEGLETAEKKRPDVILLDLMMPVMSGEEMLQHLRATDWGKIIPVFVLTNLGDDATMTKVKRYNIQQYIVKANYSPSQIVEIVKVFVMP